MTVMVTVQQMSIVQVTVVVQQKSDECGVCEWFWPI